MAVNHRGVADFGAKLLALQEDMPNIMSDLVVGEGVYAVKRARQICKTDPSEPKRKKIGVANTGNYRNSWASDDHALRRGNSYSVRFYNPLDYSIHLEYGFRSHFVPGEALYGPVRSAFPDGFYIGKKGGYVRGHFTLKRAKRRTLDSQGPRLKRRLGTAIQQHMK